MGHEGQLDNLLDDCCGYLACVFTGNGFFITEFRQPIQVRSHREMPGILVQLGHIQRT